MRSYPVVERDHLVWIWMGDPAKADPSPIVDFPYLHDPHWRGVPDYMHYDANWLLIVDNLSDFAHLAFVHTKTLGGSEEYAFETQAGRRSSGWRDGFRVERWHMNASRRRSISKVIADKAAKVDRRNIGTHAGAGHLLPGDAVRAGRQRARRRATSPARRQYRNCQFMTPETRRTTHFFWNYLNNFEGDDPTISQSLHHSLIEGFMEDKASSKASRKSSTPIPTSRCRRSWPTRRSRISGARSAG